MGIQSRSARLWFPIVLAGIAGASWLAYFNYRVTGHPLRLPYRQYYVQYETVPPFWFIPTSTPSQGFQEFDLESRTLGTYENVRSWRLLAIRAKDWLMLLSGYYGNPIWLLPLAAFSLYAWRSKRTRFAVILTLAMGAASVTEVWWYPHYGAPIAATLLILAAQSMRYLKQWRIDGREVGSFLVRAIPVAVLVVMIVAEVWAIATHRTLDQLKGKNVLKESIEQRLLEMWPGQHVIFVRYTGPSPHLEWVYNPADIDAAPVMWAQDLGKVQNERLRAYYAGRTFWLFKPDESMGLMHYR